MLKFRFKKVQLQILFPLLIIFSHFFSSCSLYNDSKTRKTEIKLADNYVTIAVKNVENVFIDSALVNYYRASQLYQKYKLWNKYLDVQCQIGWMLIIKKDYNYGSYHIKKTINESEDLGYIPQAFLANYQSYVITTSVPGISKEIKTIQKNEAINSAVKLIKSGGQSDIVTDAIQFLIRDYDANISDQLTDRKNYILQLDSLHEAIYKFNSGKFIYEFDELRGIMRITQKIQVDIGISNLENALIIASQLHKNFNEKVRVIKYLLEGYSFMGAYKKADQMILNEIQDQNSSDPSIFMMIANLMDEQGRFNEALYYYQMAEQAADKYEPNLLPYIFYNKSFVLKNLGEPEVSVDLLIKALNLFGEQLFSLIGFKESHPIPTIDKSNEMKYYHAKDFEFLECLLSADLKDGNNLDDILIHISNCYNNLGEVALDMDRNTLAQENFLKSAKWFQRGLKQIHYSSKTIYGNLETITNLIKLAQIKTDTAAQKKYLDYFYGFRDLDVFGSKPAIRTDFTLLEAKYLDQISDFKEAERVGNEALVMSRKYGLLMSEIEICHFLANLYSKTGRTESATNYFNILTQKAKEMVLRNYHGLSENEKFKFISTMKIYLNDIFKHSILTYKENESLSTLIYNNLLFYNKLLLLGIVSSRRVISNLQDPELIQIYNDILSAKSSLSDLYMKRDLHDSNFEFEIKTLGDTISQLERILSNKSKHFKELYNFNISWEEIQDSLNINESILEFFKVDFFNNRSSCDSTIYYVLLLKKDIDYPKIIRLFNEKEVDGLLKKNPINRLYSNNQASSSDTESLYHFIWAPVENLFDNIETIFISPTGILYNISFSAIVKPDNSTISDQYHLNMVHSSKAILQKTRFMIKNEKKLTAAIYGGINYEHISSAENSSQGESDFKILNDSLFSYVPYNRRNRNISWTYLPGTLREAESVNSILAHKKLRTKLITGDKATETSIKNLYQFNTNPSPTILHFSTHGFYTTDTLEWYSGLKYTTNNDAPEKIYQKRNLIFSDDPLFRSGLVFAGANMNMPKATRLGKTDDGVLTSYEISNLDLMETQLVTLSACKTGIGVIADNEGVFGLQRAFKIAGVRYLIMSLWDIPDQETVEFMEAFYKNLIKGLDINEAFRVTQLRIKNRFEPSSWASFVLIE